MPPISRLDVVCSAEQLASAYTKHELARFCSRHSITLAPDSVKQHFADAVARYLHQQQHSNSNSSNATSK